MGFDDRVGRGSQGTGTPPRSSGRGFAAVDPERQREIDLEHLRILARREEPWARSCRPAQAHWFSPRDGSDEGGSSRRSR